MGLNSIRKYLLVKLSGGGANKFEPSNILTGSIVGWSNMTTKGVYCCGNVDSWTIAQPFGNTDSNLLIF
jgi:hypothetical protein